MEKELKYKIIMRSAAVLILVISFAAVIFLNFDFYIFLSAAFFCLLFLLLVEVYLRIQHNIDKTINIINIVSLQEQKIAQTQDKLYLEMENAKKVYESIVDLLEILTDYLEEVKKKEGGAENL